MPAKGKHRRPKSQRFTRSIAVAGTGGAALALPLMGATGAHAATSQSVPEKAVQSLPVTQKSAEKTAAKKDTAKASTVRTYSVRVGDCLSKIADEQNVAGGWKKLYADNREAVGDDPSLIHPGLKLSIGKKAAAGAAKTGSPAKSSAPKHSSPKPEKAEAKPAAATQSTGSSSGYTLPVTGATIGTGYHVAGAMWSSGYHTGVDFVVPTGTPLKAVAAGTVVSAGWGGAYGNQVVIKLNDGYYAQYAHLSQLSVSAGQTVSEGQQIGLSGATGNVTGPHLHFEIRTTPDYGSDVDPVAYLRSKGVAVG
ncbi:peptidoglycan DD-metalloendopeptidase family protein [Streptomyces griseorubiginosus]|uniref:Peptidase n=1 Tax=Streptomyces griseorubiginosus TaxID=67304 RepID=A0A101S5M1_9ACTN|nr:M23 family metallopeptidase [Streptomyces griseorubiginosus]KUN67675.1 peptidase [Streptomyces griseorubiginosus]